MTVINQNFGYGRVRVGVRSAESAAFAVNDSADALAVGDEVLPNYVDKSVQRRHARGVIIRITGGVAQVRWAPGARIETLPLRHLTKPPGAPGQANS